MNLHDLTVERLARQATAPRITPPAAPADAFAKVYDLEAARRTRPPYPIPDEVLVQVDAAVTLYEELHADGQHLRFGLHDGSGRVVVDLVDLSGRVLRPIPLTDAVTATDDPDPAAYETNTPGISLSGLASGRDTNLIVSQLKTIERQPRTRISCARPQPKPGRRGLRDIVTKLRTLKLGSAELRSTPLWIHAQKMTHNDDT